MSTVGETSQTTIGLSVTVQVYYISVESSMHKADENTLRMSDSGYI